MKRILWVATALLCWLLAMEVSAAELKKPGLSPSDALFDPHRVIKVQIRLDPEDWLALRISHPILEDENNISITEQGYKYYPAEVRIDGEVLKRVGVRKKGAWGSTSSSQPALKIKFDEYEKQRRFVGLDMLTLNNDSGDDPAKFQPILIYSFLRKAGVPAPRCNAAHVTVNGEDLGRYANVESIRKQFIERLFTHSDGNLYEPQNGADFRTNLLPRIEHKFGDDDQLAHLRPLVDLLAKLEPVSLREVEILVDLKGFLTFWAAEVLIGLGDGYAENQNNYYLYRPRNGRLAFIPWGADVGFQDKSYGVIQVPKSVKATGYLCRRFWELPEIRERYREEMRRLLRETWNEEELLSELGRVTRLEGQPELAGQSKDKADSVVRFIKTRRAGVEAELKGPAPDWPKLPRWNELTPALDTNAPITIEGSFRALVAQSFPSNLTNILGEGFANFSCRVTNGTINIQFTRFGAIAAPRIGPKGSTVVRIVASTESGELRWNLAFLIDPYCLAPGKLVLNPFTVLAPLTQSDASMKNVKGKYVREGTIELADVSTNFGGTISGKFKINTTAFEEAKKP